VVTSAHAKRGEPRRLSIGSLKTHHLTSRLPRCCLQLLAVSSRDGRPSQGQLALVHNFCVYLNRAHTEHKNQRPKGKSQKAFFVCVLCLLSTDTNTPEHSACACPLYIHKPELLLSRTPPSALVLGGCGAIGGCWWCGRCPYFLGLWLWLGPGVAARRPSPRNQNEARGVPQLPDPQPTNARPAAPRPSTKGQAPRAKHQGPSTKGQAPRAKHQGPSTKRQAPSAKHQAPRAKHQAPRTKHQAPSTPPSTADRLLRLQIASVEGTVALEPF
jgi:hypothetical protein